MNELPKNRPECRAGLNDRPFSSERTSRADGESRRNRLQDAYPHSHAALPQQDRLHSLRDSVPFQGRLPEVDQDAHQQPSDGRNEDDPSPQVVMHGINDGKGPLAVEEQVSEQIDQLEQALRHQAGDKADHRGVGGRFYHRGFDGNAEFPKPSAVRLALNRIC